MELLLALWSPILLSAVAVWILSIVFGMALPHHKKDWIALADEDGLMAELRRRGIGAGNYLFPDFRTSEQLKSERVERALKEGPVGHLSVWKTPVTMGDKMVGTFVVHLVVCTLIAYLTRTALAPVGGGWSPPDFARVFRIAGTAGILAYSFAFIPNALWFGAYKRTIVASVLDGVVYGVVIGAIFAWRWPHP